jgi:NAD(P)-dependent dehydrogenase (short-subunit alcohol dehydrogenase family)
MRIVVAGAGTSLGRDIYESLREDHQVYGIGLHGPDRVLDFNEIDDFDGADEIIGEAHERLDGVPDVFIYNAGVTRIDNILEQSSSDWDEILHINTKVPYLLAQAMTMEAKAYQDMEVNRRFRFIAIASMAYRVPLRCSTAYNASKAGLVMAMKSMAKECANKYPIDFFSISPNGIADTGMMEQILQAMVAKREFTREKAEEYVKFFPIGRLCRKREVVAAVNLAMEAPSYMSGHVFDLAGGAS